MKKKLHQPYPTNLQRVHVKIKIIKKNEKKETKEKKNKRKKKDDMTKKSASHPNQPTIRLTLIRHSSQRRTTTKSRIFVIRGTGEDGLVKSLIVIHQRRQRKIV